MTKAGIIIAMSPPFIMMWTHGGEDTTETAIGTDTGGTMSGFLINDFNETGAVGIMIDIGKEGGEPGVSRTIGLDQSDRDRNWDNRENGNISRDLRLVSSSRDKGHRDNLRFSSQGNNFRKEPSHRDSLGFSSRKDNLRRESYSRDSNLKRGSSHRDNLRFSSQDSNFRKEFSHRDSLRRKFSSHNALSLKENLKGGKKNIIVGW
jgi:hypothetical protein